MRSSKLNVISELDKISKLVVRKHQVVRRVMYDFKYSDESFEDWFSLSIKHKCLYYEFEISEKSCKIGIGEMMLGTTDWIEEQGRTTEEACRKAITKFYKSYKKVQK